MIVDYHTHTRLCRHAQGDLEEYVQAAIRMGLDEIGCSDHAPLPGNFDARHRMTEEEYYREYAPKVSATMEKYAGKIRIRRAIEIDHLDWATEWNRRFIEKSDFDYVLGSVHFVGPPGSERPLFGPHYGPDELASLYEDYYRAIAQSAASGLFDVISHCDIVKKFGSFGSKRVDELIMEAMVRIRDAGICVEINTSGLRKPERETYPGEQILAIAKDLGIPLAVGSDAHTPVDVGGNFEVAVDLIERYGDGKISIFDKRVRSQVLISDQPPRNTG